MMIIILYYLKMYLETKAFKNNSGLRDGLFLPAFA